MQLSNDLLKFSTREIEVARAMKAGKSTKMIAEQLKLAYNTVKCHRSRIMRKIGCSNAVEAVAKLIEIGVL